MIRSEVKIMNWTGVSVFYSSTGKGKKLMTVNVVAA